jgi:hypothetical protein
MAKKMAAAEETKRTAPPDVWLLSPRSDVGSHTWEWSNTCLAPAVLSVIVLVAKKGGVKYHGLAHYSSPAQYCRTTTVPVTTVACIGIGVSNLYIRRG